MAHVTLEVLGGLEAQGRVAVESSGRSLAESWEVRLFV